MLDLVRNYWYDIGVVSGIVALRISYVRRKSLNTTRKLLIASFVAVLVHQFEEYRFPGGFPLVMNVSVQESTRPDRYPLNQNSAMVTNVLATYGFYLPAIFFPEITWFGLATMLFGFGQFPVHGVMINLKQGTWYNPGLASVMLMNIPIGIAYIKHTMDMGILHGRDWVLGVVLTLGVGYLLLIKTTFGWLPDYDSPYPFRPDELRKWGAPTKLRALL